MQLVAPDGPEHPLPTDAQAARAEFLASGGSIASEIPDCAAWGLIIDGLFGIGLKRAPAGHHAACITTMNRLAQRDNCPLLALDCPSGLDADSGQAARPTVQATHTLCFIGLHPGLYTNDGPDYSGDIQLAPLDLPQDETIQPDGHLLQRETFAAHLRPRRRNSHKGSYGSVGVLGGSRAMAGAAFLSARAALMLGAGRVYLGLLDADAPSVDLLQPELMLRRPDQLLTADLHALACGPGLGQSSEATDHLEQALKSPCPWSSMPMHSICWRTTDACRAISTTVSPQLCSRRTRPKLPGCWAVQRATCRQTASAQRRKSPATSPARLR